MYYHKSVLLKEATDGLNLKYGIYVDGTYGGGGHTAEIAKAAQLVIAIDRDKEALTNPAPPNVKLIHGNFKDFAKILDGLGILKIDGMLLDLGMSFHQTNSPHRGFSYMRNAPLDMRMDTAEKLTAKDILHNYSLNDLVKIFKTYGQEPFARPIAKAIKKTPPDSTKELADLILNLTPKKFGLASVKRIFQAVRIEVNQELNIIESTVADAISRLNIGGRLCIITFHSLEDRIVKQSFKKLTNPCACPIEMPCICTEPSLVKIITKKPVLPREQEIKHNPGAKSAKLRIAERI